MVNTAIACWGSGSVSDAEEAFQPHEAGILKLDISKAISQLNWYPKLNAWQTVEYTINWYKAFAHERQNIEEVTLNQIMQFFSIK